MKNQKSVFVGDIEYTCTQFYDVDTSTDGIDISNEKGQHIGEILGEVIPDIEDEEDNIRFDKVVENWIIQKTY